MKAYPKKVLFLALFLASSFSIEAQAKKYAVVVGGKSQEAESTHHEFARNTIAVTKGLSAKGYEVTTFFGSPPQALSQPSQEQSKYAADYKYIKQFNPKQATSSQVSSYFEKLIKKIKTGDQVEIYISAHGNDSCGSSGLYISNDIGSNCEHTFTLFDEKGKPTEYSSKKLFDHLKQLEEKGALPTIVFNSCHSGRLKNKLKQVGLKNTCSYFQTAGNETGYGCFEDDPNFSKDFTSTGEYVSLRYYHHILDDLSKDPYFSEKNKTCFNKIKQHFKTNNLSLETVNSAYWSSRLYDETSQSPSTSDQLKNDYFIKGLMFPQLSQKKPLSCSQINIAVDELFRQANQIKKHTNTAVKKPLKTAITSYNDLLQQLENSIKENKPTEHIISLQQNVDEASKLVIQEERKLVDGLFNSPQENLNCQRSL